MRGYPQSRAVSGPFTAVARCSVTTGANLLERVSIRDQIWIDLCPWLVRHLTPGLADNAEPSEDQVTAASEAFLERGIVLDVEVVLVSGAPLVLAQTAEYHAAAGEEPEYWEPVQVESDNNGDLEATITASSDVPVRGLIWPNAAKATEWYWGTDDQGEAVVEVTVNYSILPSEQVAALVR